MGPKAWLHVATKTLCYLENRALAKPVTGGFTNDTPNVFSPPRGGARPWLVEVRPLMGQCLFPGWHRHEHGALVNNKCRKICTGVGNSSTTHVTLTAVEMNSRLTRSEVCDKLPQLWHGSTLTHFNRSLENYRTI